MKHVNNSGSKVLDRKLDDKDRRERASLVFILGVHDCQSATSRQPTRQQRGRPSMLRKDGSVVCVRIQTSSSRDSQTGNLFAARWSPKAFRCGDDNGTDGRRTVLCIQSKRSEGVWKRGRESLRVLGARPNLPFSAGARACKRQ